MVPGYQTDVNGCRSCETEATISVCLFVFHIRFLVQLHFCRYPRNESDADSWEGARSCAKSIVSPSLSNFEYSKSFASYFAKQRQWVDKGKANYHLRLPCKLIYVHLPFDQHSRLEVRAGQTARDAISKLLKKRNITPQLCHVNVSEDPRSEQIDLNEDLESIAARLDKNELWVHSEYLDTVSSIKHTIVRRTFIPPVNCDVCKNPIWLVGYRCEFCQFKFHQRCSSFAPLYCDLIQTVPRDEALAQRLLLLASRMEGQDAEIAESVLNQLQPNPSPAHTPEGSHGDLTLKRGGGVKRHQPPTAAKESTGPLAPYPRDRSSSAPNINAINDEVVLEHNQRILDALEIQHHVDDENASRSLRNNKPRPQFQSGQLAAINAGSGVGVRRPTNRLHPRSDTSPFGSNSPSSTCSSPPANQLHAGQLLPPTLPLTPPQSAPPQKVPLPNF
ncbi:Raf-like Ras-binding domain protein [Ancylostoma caninum]|uniref:Raf-like Ras-binding domain protein n=1 Tax=Ancylostoma caninum TaxID=29170 RepID=A0A368FZL2_ANCCA|nr:Raf-like Ras-binding domain protein [Ancylostoma caninum]